jgi:hypothetical protein
LTSKFRFYAGLREFWDKANAFSLVAVACCKQYCLSDSELYCVSKAESRAPKLSAALIFLVTFWHQGKKVTGVWGKAPLIPLA